MDLKNRQTTSAYVYHQPILSDFVSKISNFARVKMFNTVMAIVKPDAQTTVLDVGVTSDSRPDSNFFERLYPYPEKITAVGMEDASFLEEQYAGVKFQLVDGKTLPFPDNSFDLAVSFAVLEHVGNREQQAQFLRELCRVANKCVITTPNRWYPIEFHTLLPFVHWLPSQVFRSILRAIGNDFLSKEENLNLLSEADVLALLPKDLKIKTEHFRLLGPISNLLFYVEKTKTS